MVVFIELIISADSCELAPLSSKVCVQTFDYLQLVNPAFVFVPVGAGHVLRTERGMD